MSNNMNIQEPNDISESNFEVPEVGDSKPRNRNNDIYLVKTDVQFDRGSDLQEGDLLENRSQENLIDEATIDGSKRKSTQVSQNPQTHQGFTSADENDSGLYHQVSAPSFSGDL